MTIEECLKIKESFRQNELFQKSSSPYKEFQFNSWHEGGEGSPTIQGQRQKIDNINGVPQMVLIEFDNDGCIHGNLEDNKPAIEYPGHWEYWNHGLIEKVIDNFGDTEEYWENGVPIRIETNLINRREIGENI